MEAGPAAGRETCLLLQRKGRPAQDQTQARAEAQARGLRPRRRPHVCCAGRSSSSGRKGRRAGHTPAVRGNLELHGGAVRALEWREPSSRGTSPRWKGRLGPGEEAAAEPAKPGAPGDRLRDGRQMTMEEASPPARPPLDCGGGTPTGRPPVVSVRCCCRFEDVSGRAIYCSSNSSLPVCTDPRVQTASHLLQLRQKNSALQNFGHRSFMECGIPVFGFKLNIKSRFKDYR